MKKSIYLPRYSPVYSNESSRAEESYLILGEDIFIPGKGSLDELMKD